MRTESGNRRELRGDWRRRIGTHTDAHLYVECAYQHHEPVLGASGPCVYDLASPEHHHAPHDGPLCGRVIPYHRTIALDVGRPCTDCLVAALTRPGRMAGGLAE